ncbi:MAG: dicarboxylate/amino acid:cation symporter [Enterococcaceae bacterium]|jgi:Na+/H+-dicarboxylate symporter|nr:dicarboxylate/amino acid:cation symporter [Enterococcaceae bacterium]MCI1918813.1 dicarboxylate/amino acid:cation symporter [Enterococcaceae bacterium]
MKIKGSMISQIMIAVVLGILFGLLLPSFAHSLEIFGQIFLRLMQMAIPLLVLGQIIQAVGGIKPAELTKLGVRTILVFGISSVLAAAWGILLAVLFKPGVGVNLASTAGAAVKTQTLTAKETVLSFFSDNIFSSLSKGSIVQIIVFAILFGLALGKLMQLHPESKLYQIILDFNEVIIEIIRFVMYLAPLGIFALIASTISNLGLKIIIPLVKYLAVYGTATFLFMAIWLIVLMIYGKLNPLRMIRNMKDMSVMALATTSSAVTLPIEMEEAKHKLGLSPRVANLVLPLGMSLNSNGAAMHMALTVVTIAQMYQVEFDLQKLLYLAIMATFVSLANAVVPGAGLVSLAIIVPQMGLPIESIAIFAGVEWFVGMLRTILNVNSDVYSAVLVAKSTNELDYTIFNQKD